ncbi:MAG TPA: chemotaxis protein CheA [Syntrophobacteraceae bacterium]|nr:chemotaxis protein CheA [Syntrophobacteraceae bacterium]
MQDNPNGDLDAQLLAQMLQDFIEESQEHLDQLNLNLTKLEDRPDDQEIINETFRVIHTLKGTSSFVGLDQVRVLSHKMEDVFGAIRKGALAVTAPIVDIMFEALEVLTLLRNNAAGKAPIEVDISWIVNKIEGVLEGPSGQSPGAEKAPLSTPEALPETQSQTNAAGPGPSAGGARHSAETIRVSTERLDNLMNLAGELITARNRLNDLSQRLKDMDLSEVASSIDHLTRQIHGGIMRTRMVPIAVLFNKFPGIMRNLARERNKQVELVVEGEDTELDKTVIEQIYDPMVHLLRNAVDHGIEPPELRQRSGKPPAGRIALSAWHHQNNVMIQVEDDGRGIDAVQMRDIAVEKGVLTREEARGMADEQAVRLIFVPGFSSAEKVSEVSGRGVGMDVVKEHVQRLRGNVDVQTVVGKGTRFRIEMPLTLAVLQALLLKSGGLVYALPLSAVFETLLIGEEEINTIEKEEVVFIRGIAHPLKRLASILKFNSIRLSGKDPVPVVLVGLADKRVVLRVDELLGRQEVVMKGLGKYLGQVEGIEGATILSDGSIALIVDVEAVLRKAG